jgi:outer membrane protein TolC
MFYFSTGALVLRKHTPGCLSWLAGLIGIALLAVGLRCAADDAVSDVTSGRLSLESALRLATERSQSLAATKEDARASQEMTVAAEQLPDPVLSLAIENLPANGDMRYSLTDDFMTMRSIGLSQTLTRKDKRQARATVFERKTDVAWASHAVELTALQQNTARAWFNLYYLREIVVLLTRARDEIRLQLDAAETAYGAGRGSQSDVFRLHSELARFEDRVSEIEAQDGNAVIILSRWLGNPVTLPLASPPPITQLPSAEHAFIHQLDQHPEIQRMTAKQAEALARAEVARQEKRADWSVSLMYGQRGPEYSDMVSLGVSVPLQWDQTNRQDREVSASLALAEKAAAEREEMIREHTAETQRWLATWQSNLVRLDHYDSRIIPLARDFTNAALAEYRGGRGDLASVLEARRQEIETRIDRVRLESATASLWVALEFLLPREKSVIQAESIPDFAESINPGDKP